MDTPIVALAVVVVVDEAVGGGLWVMSNVQSQLVVMVNMYVPATV
jgi:hypothetical protein